MADDAEVDHVLLTEVGRLAVLAGIIEGHLAGITAMLISPRITAVGYAVVGDRTNFKHLADLAKKVITDQLRATDSPAADMVDPIRAWIGDAERVMNHRNRMLHAVWMISASGQTAVVLRRSGETEDVSLGKVRGHVADAEAVATRGGDLWFELTHRYGHFDALIEATKAMDPDWFSDDEAGPEHEDDSER